MGDRGQASVELLASLPALLLAGCIGLQLLAVGFASTLADGAAEAAALAVSSGRSPRAAARAALPGWARGDVSVAVDGGRVTVRIVPPAVIPPLGRRLAISSSAEGRPPQP